MSTTKKCSPVRLLVAAIVIMAIACGIVAFGFAVKRRGTTPERSTLTVTYRKCDWPCRTTKPRMEAFRRSFLRDSRGRPIQSWRALVVPYIEMDSLKPLDLSQPWDSAGNRKIIDKVPQHDWGWFARDIPTDRPPPVTYLFAWTGADSLWDAKTGLPRGTIRENPKAVLLISVPKSTIHPLEPRDLTEVQVRALVEDGQEVLFIQADVSGGYGLVTMDHGRLVFKTWREP